MFGVIKKLFSRKSSDSAESSAISLAAARQSPSSTDASGQQSPDANHYDAAGNDVMAEGESLQISLRSLVHGMPKELQTKHASSIPSDAFIKLYRGALVAQLAQGAVRVPFGLIRKLSPAGIFPTATDHDNKLVEIPLKELIRTLGPAAFSRRGDQKVTDTPTGIEDLFGAKGQGLRILKKEELKPSSGEDRKSTRLNSSH